MHAVWVIVSALFGASAEAGTWAVVDFQAHVDEPSLAALGPGVADMLRTDLVRSGQVTVVERSQLDALLGELTLQQSGAVDPASAVQIGRLAGAETVVLGSVHASGGVLRLDARLVSVETGVAAEAASVEGSLTELFALEHELATRLVGGAWTPLGPQDVQTADLTALFGGPARPAGAPTVERRPANPAPPPTAKVCKRVESIQDPIDGVTRRTASAPLMVVSESPAGVVMTLRLPAMLGMKVNGLVGDPALYRGDYDVQLLLTDGTLITLPPQGTITPSASIGGGVEARFELPPAVIEALASAGPERARWRVGANLLDLPVASGDAEKLWRPAFACLLGAAP